MPDSSGSGWENISWLKINDQGGLQSLYAFFETKIVGEDVYSGQKSMQCAMVKVVFLNCSLFVSAIDKGSILYMPLCLLEFSIVKHIIFSSFTRKAFEVG